MSRYPGNGICCYPHYWQSAAGKGVVYHTQLEGGQKKRPFYAGGGSNGQLPVQAKANIIALKLKKWKGEKANA